MDGKIKFCDIAKHLSSTFHDEGVSYMSSVDLQRCSLEAMNTDPLIISSPLNVRDDPPEDPADRYFSYQVPREIIWSRDEN